jgi:hypothetical protein
MSGSVDVRGLRVAANAGERGSALLIVFVFAAMLAIMLYMELPVAMFEAQRQKEQLLIDRGNEYAHAVKLYVRKLGTYPPSMDALEKTNQMRFLRHRFKDPFTGKDDWRILHAGPNGILIDSKVKQTGLGLGANGMNGPGMQNGANGSGVFGSSSNSGSSFNSASSGFGNTSGTAGSSFGRSSANSGFGSFGSGNGSNSDSTPPEMVVKRPPQRGPAMAANGIGKAAAPGSDQDPLAPLLAPGQTDTGQLPGADTSPGAEPGQTGTPGQPVPGEAGQNATPGGLGNASSQPVGTAGTGSTIGTMGTINSGGIAGVASKAAGHSIKVVNDQTDYSLWEFYYDPTKDAMKGISNALGAMGASQQANQQQNGMTPFGSNSSGTNSPFNSNNSFGNGNSFGSNSGNSGTTNTSPTSTAPSSSTTPPQ